MPGPNVVRIFSSWVKCGLRPPPLIAGPVRSSLRCGRPARRRRTPKGPDNPRTKLLRPPGPCNQVMLLWCVRAGLLRSRSWSRSITTGQGHVPGGITLAREPGPVALARKDWPLRRQALGMILRVLRWGDQRQVRMLRGDLRRARRCQERMSQLVSAVGFGEPGRRRVD